MGGGVGRRVCELHNVKFCASYLKDANVEFCHWGHERSPGGPLHSPCQADLMCPGRGNHDVPSGPPVSRTHGTRHGRGVWIPRKLRIRNTNLQWQIFTHLEAEVTEKTVGACQGCWFTHFRYLSPSHVTSTLLPHTSFINHLETSLVILWLRIHLARQGMWVRSLVWELGSHMPQCNQALGPQLPSLSTATRERACVLQQRLHMSQPRSNNAK